MALLDTFTLLFETNAEDAAEEVNNLNETLDETESAADDAADAINGTSRASDQGGRAFNNLANTVKSAIAAYLSFSAIKAAIFDRAVATDVVGKFSDTLGLSVEQVDDWSEAVIRSGGSAESFRGSVESLNKSMGDIALGGGGEIQEVFGRLGISALDARGKIKDVFSVLPELADAFQRLNKQESVAFGQKLGLDQGTILLLQQGRDNVEALVERQRQLGGITEEGAAASAEFNDAWADSKRVLIGWADSIGQFVWPALTTLLTGFQDFGIWINENQDLVEGFFIGVTAVLVATYLPAIKAAAAATLVAMLPFIKIAAVVGLVGTAIALLYEDIKAFVNGQESLLGKLIAKYGWLRDAIDFVSRGFDVLAKLHEEAVDTVSRSFEALDELHEKSVDVMSRGIELLAENTETARDITSRAIEGIINAYKSARLSLTDFFEAFAKMYDDIKLSATDAIEWIINLINKVIAKFLEFRDKVLGIVSSVKGTFKDLQESLSFDVDIGGTVSVAFDKAKDFVFGDDEEEENEPQKVELEVDEKGFFDRMGSFIFGEDEEKQIEAVIQAEVALKMQREVNANPILAAPGGMTRSRVSYIEQNNTFKTDIQASGMSSQEAKSAFTSSFNEQLAKAKSQIDDGVDR